MVQPYLSAGFCNLLMAMRGRADLKKAKWAADERRSTQINSSPSAATYEWRCASKHFPALHDFDTIHTDLNSPWSHA
jgi:hypothetical protein